MKIDSEFLRQEKLDSETINKVVKEFQKAGKNYNGIQCAVALELLLKVLCPTKKQRKFVSQLVDDFYNVNTEDN